MGVHLLAETSGVSHQVLAAALAESLLLAGRIEFFDLQRPDEADRTLVRALQAAGEADDPLLGSAIHAHAAFIPGWVKEREKAADRIRAARVYARRGPASAEFLAWLDAVEAECETICGNNREALRLINHAETVLAGSSGHQSPSWFTWSRLSVLRRSRAIPSSRPGIFPRRGKRSPVHSKPRLRQTTSSAP